MQSFFETELIPEGGRGVKLERLSQIHSHYFGGGFERIVGVKLRAFVQERYEYVDGSVKAPVKLLNALRKAEARELVGQLLDYEEDEKQKLKQQRAGKRNMPDIASMMSNEARMERSQNEMDIMQGKRPRYASTKIEPDECEDHGGMMGKGGGGAGMSGVMPGGMGGMNFM